MIRLNWGWKIALLYTGFVIFMTTLVIKSTQQHFYLVSENYYADELAFQKTIDASKNEAALANPITISANSNTVTAAFPEVFAGRKISGTIDFYSPVNSNWDKIIPLNTSQTSVVINRNELRKINYLVKISYSVDGKNYYQEDKLNLEQ